MRGFTQEPDDPLTLALAPPSNETSEEREVRLKKEAEAQRVSDLIDENLRAERAALKKRKIMKMLLLGQSESGKTTTLKNMQLTYAPKAWALEKASWRAVIQLNLIRSINAILDALAVHLTGPAQPAQSIRRVTSPPPSPTSEDDTFTNIAPRVQIPPEKRNFLLKLKLRLTPLRRVEIDLKARLGAGTDEVTEANSGFQPMTASPFDDPPHTVSPRPSRELIVRSHQFWKSREKERKEKDRSSFRPTSAGATDAARDSATDVLAGCEEDMLSLWSDPFVRDLADKMGLLQALGDSAEYFLERISAIADRDYTPSDEDVLRARIRTLGVQEYNLVFEVREERDVWREWAIYDVGGSRTQRRAWVPYFTDVQAILFLAPVSVFDERLAEDRSVNRLQDSFTLWESIVKSSLLKNSILILFMNKCDILKRKLDRGVPVKKYMPSYSDRANDFPTFSKYLRTKFRDLLLQNSSRQFYGHMTSCIDVEATATTLRSVRDGILQAHLKQASFV